MSKLVWRENSPYCISIYLVQEYVISSCRYTTATLKVVPKVYKGLNSSFLSLTWSWPGRSHSQGEPVGVLVPWTGAQCGQAPSSPFTNYSSIPIPGSSD